MSIENLHCLLGQLGMRQRPHKKQKKNCQEYARSTSLMDDSELTHASFVRGSCFRIRSTALPNRPEQGSASVAQASV